MPTYNISDPKYKIAENVRGYVNNTNSKLSIESVVTSNSLELPAFLTDFSQTFDATWNTEDVFGRMDPIATYQGTKRTMSLGFDIPAGNLEQAEFNLKLCSLLTTMVYPIYEQEETERFVPSSDPNLAGEMIFEFGPAILSKPPLVRVKFANLIVSKSGVGLLGWITGLSWKPNLEAGMFTSGGQQGKLYPKIISISFSFNILHEMVLNQSTLAETNWPFGD